MKRVFGFAILSGMAAFAVGQASANLIVNGDFEAGNTGFTSGYGYTSASGGLATGGEGSGAGLYAIGPNAQFYHPSFTKAADHTSGAGNMMIVNGSLTANKTVWSQTIVPPLTIGATYQFSAWVMNVFPDSPASLQFSFGGNTLGTMSATGNGVWQQFTATFVAGNSIGNAIDLNLAFSGNDFALDDLSLVAVPEPTTMVAGALLLLPLAAGTLRKLRNNTTT